MYFALLLCLSLYGAHRSILLYFYRSGLSNFRQRSKSLPVPAPLVTVQIPLFNERYVAGRVIDAVAKLRYPRDRFQVQLLDDSTDDTSRIARAAVRKWKARGVSIDYRHRTSRIGFKAGALAEGLREARGEFIAVFDADFMPKRDFLERTVWVFSDQSVGMVQARWDHANRCHSLLTRVQALLLDAHFVLEHGGRYRAGRFFNFNGTAGLWRRAAIESVGGWHRDTLTEDLDLSYRAQLAGWRFVFLSDVVAPGELPVDMVAFKSQQHRWAKGSIQTCRKLLPTVLRARIPLRIKSEAFFHLTANFNYVLLVALAVLIVPVMVLRTQSETSYGLFAVDVPLFGMAALSVTNFYVVTQRELRSRWWTRVCDIPALISLSLGLSVNNAVAVFEGLSSRTGEFRRTPKYGTTSTPGLRGGSTYAQVTGRTTISELAFGFYFSAAVVYALSVGLYKLVPFLLFFQFGFFYVAVTSLSFYGTAIARRERRS